MRKNMVALGCPRSKYFVLVPKKRIVRNRGKSLFIVNIRHVQVTLMCCNNPDFQEAQ